MKTLKTALTASNIFAMLFTVTLLVITGCSDNPLTQSDAGNNYQVSSIPNSNEQTLFWSYTELSVEARGVHYVEQQIESSYIKAGLPNIKICFEGTVELGNSTYTPILTIYGENVQLFSETNASNLNRYREITVDANNYSQLQIKGALWCDGKGDCTSASLILRNIKVYIIN